MKNVISAMTLKKDSIPTINDCGFACTGSVSRDQFMKRRIQSRQSEFINQAAILNGIMAVGAIGTKVLYSMASKSGKRSLYGATAILGYATALGTIFGNAHICDKAQTDVSNIIQDCQGLPEEMVEYKAVSAEQLDYIRRVQKGLHYDPKVDGEISVYDLIEKRIEEINDLLFKAGMYTARYDIRQLIENEQFEVLDTAKKLAEESIKKTTTIDELHTEIRKARVAARQKDEETTSESDEEPANKATVAQDPQ